MDSAALGSAAARRDQSAVLISELGWASEHTRRVVISQRYDWLSFEQIGRRLERSAEVVRKSGPAH
jgi:hypothetical protein